MIVRVQTRDFDVGEELEELCARHAGAIGAVANFVGVVRDMNDGATVAEMTLEHYPAMTERALCEIAAEAIARWRLIDAVVIHRVGTLQPCDQVVLVIAAAAHRGDAFRACEFMIDVLKTRAPFWKRETTPAGQRWVAARASDAQAVNRWDDGG